MTGAPSFSLDKQSFCGFCDVITCTQELTIGADAPGGSELWSYYVACHLRRRLSSILDANKRNRCWADALNKFTRSKKFWHVDSYNQYLTAIHDYGFVWTAIVKAPDMRRYFEDAFRAGLKELERQLVSRNIRPDKTCLVLTGGSVRNEYLLERIKRIAEGKVAKILRPTGTKYR